MTSRKHSDENLNTPWRQISNSGFILLAYNIWSKFLISHLPTHLRELHLFYITDPSIARNIVFLYDIHAWIILAIIFFYAGFVSLIFRSIYPCSIFGHCWAIRQLFFPQWPPMDTSNPHKKKAATVKGQRIRNVSITTGTRIIDNFPFPGQSFSRWVARTAIDANGKNAVDVAGRTRRGHARERVQQGRRFPWMLAASFDAFYQRVLDTERFRSAIDSSLNGHRSSSVNPSHKNVQSLTYVAL